MMQKMLAFPRPAANSQNSLSPAWLLAALPERSVGRCSAIMGIVDRPQKKLEPPRRVRPKHRTIEVGKA